VSDEIQDAIIIGAGPSALAAAIYTTRENIDTVLYEKAIVGGLVATIDKISNYPGFPDGIEGLMLAERLEKQAKFFGANIKYGDVTSIRDNGNEKIATVDGIEINTRAILIASGRSYGKIDVPGELEYFGKGVHYCATCDGAFYKNKKIVVIGGANSAVQEAIYLTRFASHIDLIVRSTIKASRILQRDLQKLIDDDKITVHLNTSVNEIIGFNGHITSLRTTKNDKPMVFETDGIFIFVGLRPNTDFLSDSGIELDEAGFIKTDSKLQTNIPGIFASGDVRSGATMQIVSAVGEGATAALSIREYLRNF